MSNTPEPVLTPAMQTAMDKFLAAVARCNVAQTKAQRARDAVADAKARNAPASELNRAVAAFEQATNAFSSAVEAAKPLRAEYERNLKICVQAETARELVRMGRDDLAHLAFKS